MKESDVNIKETTPQGTAKTIAITEYWPVAVLFIFTVVLGISAKMVTFFTLLAIGASTSMFIQMSRKMKE